MTKRILVKTDDPEKKKFNLVVTGMVEKVVDINPSAVYLDGNPGDTLESTITITPSKKYMFTILGLEQNPESGVTATLVPPTKEGESWQVMVKVNSDKPGNFFDTLVLKTDSSHTPELKIRVSALFHKGS
ncbi:MAG: hypothetical protein ABIJ59_19835 [Pseudomonadota bacterium]